MKLLIRMATPFVAIVSVTKRQDTVQLGQTLAWEWVQLGLGLGSGMAPFSLVHSTSIKMAAAHIKIITTCYTLVKKFAVVFIKVYFAPRNKGMHALGLIDITKT
jgi:hypothetical protein